MDGVCSPGILEESTNLIRIYLPFPPHIRWKRVKAEGIIKGRRLERKAEEKPPAFSLSGASRLSPPSRAGRHLKPQQRDRR